MCRALINQGLVFIVNINVRESNEIFAQGHGESTSYHILPNFLSETFLTEWFFFFSLYPWLGDRGRDDTGFAFLYSSNVCFSWRAASLFSPSLAQLSFLEAIVLPQEVWRVSLALKLAGVWASISTVINKRSTWLIFNVKALSIIDCRVTNNSLSGLLKNCRRS